jgi:hypothetical protein
LISNMEGRFGAPEAAPERTKNLTRNEKDRERRRVGGARHAQALPDKQAGIDHLRGSLMGVLGQMENFKGVADIIRDYTRSQSSPGRTTSLSWRSAGVAAVGGSEMGWRLRG